MPPPAQQSTPDRRRRSPAEAEREILDAAAALLRERPWHEVSVAAVMKRTGLTREAFYAYFTDRYELVRRLVLPLRADLDAALEALRTGDGDIVKDGRAPIAAVARLYAEHGIFLRVLAQAAHSDEEAARAWQSFSEPAIDAIRARIQAEVDTGRLRPFDVEAYVRTLVGMNVATFFEELVDRPGADTDAVVERLHTIWTRTLLGFAA